MRAWDCARWYSTAATPLTARASGGAWGRVPVLIPTLRAG